MTSIKNYVEENYGGSEKLTDKDTACIGRLLVAVGHCSRLRENAKQLAKTVKDGLEMLEKHRAEYGRLMRIGLLKAAQEVMEPCPKIVDDIQAARRQLAELPAEIEKARAGFVDLSGLKELQADFRQTAETFYRLQEKLGFVERTAGSCLNLTTTHLVDCKAIVDEAEREINIPLEPVNR